jgi:hypothetical protein
MYLVISKGNTAFLNMTTQLFLRELSKKAFIVFVYTPGQVVSRPVKSWRILYLPLISRNAWRPSILSVIYRRLLTWFINRNFFKNLVCLDSFGLHQAIALLGDISRYKLHYFSFEIFFEEEFFGDEKLIKEKEIERKYMQNAKSILIQDATRMEALIEENRLIKEKHSWHLIPFSPFRENEKIYKNKIDKSINPKLRFNLSDETDLVLQLGGVKKTFGAELFIELLERGLPNNQVLILHPFDKLKKSDITQAKLIDLAKKDYPLIIDYKIFNHQKEINQYVKCFNCGMALYFPQNNPTNIWNGRNLSTMGLASGKFATYMMNGVPALTTNISLYPILKDSYAFGEIISSTDELFEQLTHRFYNKKLASECKRLFDEVIDPLQPMMRYINWLKYDEINI